MNDMRCPYKILIADGGKDAAVEQHLCEHANYPSLDYEYIRYPYDATLSDYYSKFLDVLLRVKSEYLLLTDNDDFCLLDRIPEMLAFLDANSDYVGARGTIAYFTLFNKTGLLTKEAAGKHYLVLDNLSASIDAASPYDRVDTLCRNVRTHNYSSNWYSIFRTTSFQNTWKSLSTLPIKESIVTEIMTNVLLLMESKLKIMPFPFYFRQMGVSTGASTLYAGNAFLERWIMNNSLSEFGVAVDRFIPTQTKEEKDRLLRAIAAWIDGALANDYLNRPNSMTRFADRVRSIPLLGLWMTWVYRHLTTAFLSSQRRPLRLKSIEPYILQ